MLKIKLSKKKPIKITAGAPDGEPDPAQTKVKTVHDPINRRDGQPLSSLQPGAVDGAGQPVKKKIPPEGMIQQMLGMSKEGRPNIPPKRMGGPNGDGNGASVRNGGSHDHGNSPNENGGPGGMETLRIGEWEDLLERMEIQMEVLTLMTMGMEMTLHPQQILLLPEEEGIENPNMFMYCKGLQGHQARKGNLNNLALPLIRA